MIPAGNSRGRPHPVGKCDARLRHVAAHERNERPTERDESERVDVTGQPGERCRQADQRPAVSRHPTSSVQLSLLVRSSWPLDVLQRPVSRSHCQPCRSQVRLVPSTTPNFDRSALRWGQRR